MRAYALVEVGHRDAIDVFLNRAEAYSALADPIRDEPEWAETLYIAPIELNVAAAARPN